MHNGLVKTKGRIQLPNHRHLMPFETSCLVYSCCGLWIAHKFCVVAASSYSNDVLPTKSKQFVCRKTWGSRVTKDSSAHLRMELCTVPYADSLGTKEIHHNHLFLPSHIASVTLTGNCIFIFSSPLCLTELKTFWGLNVQKVSVYWKAFILVFWSW